MIAIGRVAISNISFMFGLQIVVQVVDKTAKAPNQWNPSLIRSTQVPSVNI